MFLAGWLQLWNMFYMIIVSNNVSFLLFTNSSPLCLEDWRK